MTELEQLKALLDQRGEPYVENDFGITWRYHSDPHTATESMDGTLIVTGMTASGAVLGTLSPDIDRLKWPIEEVDYLCDMCANDCDERRPIRVGQGAYDVCSRWVEVLG